MTGVLTFCPMCRPSHLAVFLATALHTQTHNSEISLTYLLNYLPVLTFCCWLEPILASTGLSAVQIFNFTFAKDQSAHGWQRQTQRIRTSVLSQP